MHWYQWLPTIYWLIGIVVGIMTIVCNARRFVRATRWLGKAIGGFLKNLAANRRKFLSVIKEK